MYDVSLTTIQVISKLRRDMPRNVLVMRVCQELETLSVKNTPAKDKEFEQRHGFDRRSYQREYMRRSRAKVAKK